MIPAPLLPRLRRAYWAGLRQLWRARRQWFLLRVRAVARLRHARLDLQVAPDVVLGRRIRVDIDPGTTNRLVLGRSSRVQDDVLLWLRGGTIELGAGSALRRHARLNSSGALHIGSQVMISWGVVVHCAEAVSVDDLTVISEYCTVTDSIHLRTDEISTFHRVRAEPTRVGRNVWVGAHTVVAHGVEVGDRAFVGAHSVVTTDVPPMWLAAGAPAKPIRELEIEDGEG